MYKYVYIPYRVILFNTVEIKNYTVNKIQSKHWSTESRDWLTVSLVPVQVPHLNGVTISDEG